MTPGDPSSAPRPEATVPADPPTVREPESGAEIPTAHEVPAGSAALHVEVPGYEVLAELGRGAMGVVYQARHLQLRRLVALKMVLASDGVTAEQAERFRSEATAVASLQHPNIVGLYEAGTHAGQPYFALEFVEGGSLARKAGKPQPAAEAARLVLLLARAMQHAHERGIIHRDLKPANVLLTADGSPKIGDFGLAKHLGMGPAATACCAAAACCAPHPEDSSQTRSGTILGTPSFMAPEQAAGLVREIGAAADVYGLGGILYALLTGRPPFLGSSLLDTLDQVRYRDPVPPRHFNPRVPRDLETICLHCLHKDPQRRYASAQELAQDLEAFLQRRPIRARPVSFAERAAKWARRRPAVAICLVALALIVTASLAGVLMGWREATWRSARAGEKKHAANRSWEKARQDRSSAEELRAQAGGDRDEADRQLVSARVGQYQSNIARAARALSAGQAPQALRLLDDCPVELCRWEWYLLRGRFQAAQRTLPGERVMALSPTGPVLAVFAHGIGSRLGRGWAAVSLWNWQTGERIDRMAVGELATLDSLAFSPDGRVLYGVVLALLPDKSTGARLFAVDGETFKPLYVVDHPRVELIPRQVLPHPDGQSLALIGASSQVLICDAKTGKEQRRIGDRTLPTWNASFSPDGKWLALAVTSDKATTATVQLWDYATGKLVHTFAGLKACGDALSFTSDSRRLATVSQEGQFLLWSVPDGQRAGSFPCQAYPGVKLALSPDGKRAAVSQFDESVAVFDLTTQKRVALFPGFTAAVHRLEFTPDSRQLVAIGDSGAVRIWDATHDPSGPVFEAHASAVQAVAWGTMGEGPAAQPVLATAGADGLVRLWDAGPSAPERPRAEGRGHEGPVLTVAISRGGRFLASGGRDRTVRLWDTSQPGALQLVQTWKGHAGPVGRVAFEAGGRLLASAGDDRLVRIWDVTAPAREPVLCTGHQGPVRGLAWHPAGRVLVSAGADRTLRIWSPADGKLVRTLSSPQGALESVALSPDGSLIAAVCSDREGGLEIWRQETGTLLDVVRDQVHGSNDVLFSADGQRVVVAHQDSSVGLFDTAGRRLLSLPTASTPGKLCLALSPEGDRLAVGGPARRVLVIGPGPGPWGRTAGRGPIRVFHVLFSADGRYEILSGVTKKVVVMDRRTEQEVRRVSLAAPPVHLSLQPGGTLLAACAVERGTVQVVDWTGEREERWIEADPKQMVDVAFSPDGSLLATSGRSGRLCLWDPVTGEQRRLIQDAGSSPALVAFSPDSRALATLDAEGWLTLRDLTEDRVRWTARVAEADGERLTFSPDGSFLVCATADERLSLIETAGGKELWSIRAVGGIREVLFRPGKVARSGLFTVTPDGLVQERDPETGRVIRLVAISNGFTTDVVFTPDGRYLVTMEYGGLTARWQLDRPRFDVPAVDRIDNEEGR
jgi:WD40 repeat protein